VTLTLNGVRFRAALLVFLSINRLTSRRLVPSSFASTSRISARFANIASPSHHSSCPPHATLGESSTPTLDYHTVLDSEAAVLYLNDVNQIQQLGCCQPTSTSQLPPIALWTISRWAVSVGPFWYDTTDTFPILWHHPAKVIGDERWCSVLVQQW